MNNKLDTNHDEDWWREWFNEIYLDVYAHRDDNAATYEIQMALTSLPLQKFHTIVDLCCGNGRHSRILTEEGYSHVIGIDFSPALLGKAARKKPLPAYTRADMRHIPCRTSQIDAVLSFFTSFGYFPSDEENHSVLFEIARILKPGGWFFLDYLNPKKVRDTLVPFSQQTTDTYAIKEYRSLSNDQQRIQKKILVRNREGQEKNFLESVRLYELQEMQSMLKEAGLYAYNILGDFRGRQYHANSDRMIIYGTRV
jgi:ubiquinone/menaquinone biosynthesis C-methylase UbiE